MMPLRRASMIATLFLLAWAATASAECAWVLWRQTLSDNPAIPASGNWIPEGAFKSKRGVRWRHQAENAPCSSVKQTWRATRTRVVPTASPTLWTRESRRRKMMTEFFQRVAAKVRKYFASLSFSLICC